MVKVKIITIDGALNYEFNDLNSSKSWLASHSADEFMQDAIVTTEVIPPKLTSIIDLRLQIHEAYDSYIANFVSGVGIGLLTIGVIKGSPKALKFAGWLTAISADYKSRSDAIITDGQPINVDFTNNGMPPVTIWDVKTEIGM
jgi:hypothetical protein